MYDYLEGSWYEVAENEEIHFTKSEIIAKYGELYYGIYPLYEVNNILSERYNYYQSNEANTMFGYRNAGDDDSTIMVIYNSEDAIVTWYDWEKFGK